MEVGTGDVDTRHFGIGYDDTFRVAILVQLAMNGQPSLRGGRGDQLDHSLVAD